MQSFDYVMCYHTIMYMYYNGKYLQTVRKYIHTITLKQHHQSYGVQLYLCMCYHTNTNSVTATINSRLLYLRDAWLLHTISEQHPTQHHRNKPKYSIYGYNDNFYSEYTVTHQIKNKSVRITEQDLSFIDQVKTQDTCAYQYQKIEFLKYIVVLQ